MAIRTTVSGASRASNRMRVLPAQKIRAVSQALFVAGDIVKAEASVSITTGAVSGANHVPSLPGEPPNEDTGFLRTNIDVFQTGPLVVSVISGADYSAALEFGTSKMAARPFMGPAARKRRDEIIALVRRAAS